MVIGQFAEFVTIFRRLLRSVVFYICQNADGRCDCRSWTMRMMQGSSDAASWEFFQVKLQEFQKSCEIKNLQKISSKSSFVMTYVWASNFKPCYFAYSRTEWKNFREELNENNLSGQDLGLLGVVGGLNVYKVCCKNVYSNWMFFAKHENICESYSYLWPNFWSKLRFFHFIYKIFQVRKVSIFWVKKHSIANFCKFCQEKAGDKWKRQGVLLRCRWVRSTGKAAVVKMGVKMFSLTSNSYFPSEKAFSWLNLYKYRRQLLKSLTFGQAVYVYETNKDSLDCEDFHAVFDEIDPEIRQVRSIRLTS